MRSIAELMRSTALPVWEGENGGTPGAEPEPEVKTEPEVKAEPEVKTEEPEAQPEAKPEVKAKPSDWRDNEIARLRSQIERERGKPEPKPEAKAPGGNATEPDADFESRVATAGRQYAELEKFNTTANAAAKAGKATYGDDFVSRLTDITTKLVNVKDPVSATKYNLFLKDTFEAADGDPEVVAKIIYELGGDLDEADRVMNLSSVKRGVELSKLSAREAAPLSNASKPVTPVGGQGAKHETIKASDPTRADGLSTASWMERRNAEVAAQEQARGYRR